MSTAARPLLAVLLLALAVLVPRGLAITRAQSERTDDDTHLRRGAVFLRGELALHPDLPLDNPLPGSALTALPLWLAGCWRDGDLRQSALHGQACAPEAILDGVGVWRSLLSLPLFAVAFVWLRRLYGPRSAWLGVGLLLVEPTFAAHIPLPALDVLGATAIAAAAFLAWRAFEAPTRGRVAAAAAAVPLALLAKQTAVFLPPLVTGYALLWWLVRPWREGRLRASWHGALRPRLRALALSVALAGGLLFALTGFDVSAPLARHAHNPELRALTAQHAWLGTGVRLELPAGVYGATLVAALRHARTGHAAYLHGQTSLRGWWHYFPVVAAYKVPLGFVLIGMAGVASLGFVRPRFEEWGLLLPALLWTGAALASPIQIGFRHFLPAYAFLLPLATRCVARPTRLSPRAHAALVAGAWLALAGSALHAVAAYHPHYLAYLNFPRARPWLLLSDSNLDWSHGLREARRWIDAHPERAVAVRDFMLEPASVRHWVGPRARVLGPGEAPPADGVLIVGATAVSGQYERGDAYAPLRALEPDAVLAHGMLVFDLDRLQASEASTQRGEAERSPSRGPKGPRR